MDAPQREFDIVVWGATGFTGRLVAEYLLRRYGTQELRWALGGRNRAKLESVREQIGRETGVASASLPLLLGDGDDPAWLHSLAGRTRVVCTTVGPYAKYGSKLVAACAAQGTHYCDLTGEVHWIRRMIDRHQDEAAASGARIVFTCGFDSIPSDLGVFFLQREMRARHGVACSHVKYRVADFSGGMSGGTIASMLNMLEEAREDPEVMATVSDPYGLNPKDQRFGPDRAEAVGPAWDRDFGQWTAPFVMAAINTKVVRRTNALLDHPYGAEFRYDEAMLMGAGPLGLLKATGLSASTAAGMAALAVTPLRRLIARRLPAPGEGPSKQAREAGHYTIRLWGEHPTDAGRNLRACVRGDRDPGYGSTAKLLGESAVCLARDELAAPGGLSTPAAAMGEALLGRLQANAGLSFVIE
jgi:short subunit dehydrogenase-like uncharacterized protein